MSPLSSLPVPSIVVAPEFTERLRAIGDRMIGPNPGRPIVGLSVLTSPLIPRDVAIISRDVL